MSAHNEAAPPREAAGAEAPRSAGAAKRYLRASVVAALLAGLGLVSYVINTARPAPTHVFFTAKKRGTEVIAHRGGSGLRPENTLAAFDHAVKLGVDLLEMDVRLTADGELAVIHDASVDRTTNGSGAVSGMPLRELQGLDAGYHFSADNGVSFPYRGRGVRIPALKEVFAVHGAMRMVVEMKSSGETTARALCDLLRAAGMTQKILVAAFDVATLEHFRGACAEVATAMSASEARGFVFASWAFLSRATSPAAPALLLPDRIGPVEIAGGGLISAARARGLKMQVWTVNDEQRMRELLAARIDGIMTDHPDKLLAARQRP